MSPKQTYIPPEVLAKMENLVIELPHPDTYEGKISAEDAKGKTQQEWTFLVAYDRHDQRLTDFGHAIESVCGYCRNIEAKVVAVEMRLAKTSEDQRTTNGIVSTIKTVTLAVIVAAVTAGFIRFLFPK